MLPGMLSQNIHSSRCISNFAGDVEKRTEMMLFSIMQVESEREELFARLTSLKDDNKAMEELSKDQAMRLNQMDEEVARYKSSIAQLRYSSLSLYCTPVLVIVALI